MVRNMERIHQSTAAGEGTGEGQQNQLRNMEQLQARLQNMIREMEQVQKALQEIAVP
jgi:chaperonin cofactor prefoldin